MYKSSPYPLTPHKTGEGWIFCVWAPKAEKVDLHLFTPEDRIVEMESIERGYFKTTIKNLPDGAEYQYRLDQNKERPDPASAFQPRGVHANSQVVETDYQWRAAEWRGLPLEEYITYELHVGTFSKERNFDGVVSHLDELADLGITAVEIMPVAQFPGQRNWGYDGVYPYAVQNSYGGPGKFKELIDECHKRGLAVILDVVYNHLGPEGNYLWDYGYYFTENYKTPWGEAVNFDGAYSDEVRAFFIQNALRWVEEFRIDALRLDALHAVYDFSAKTFLAELVEAIHAVARKRGRLIYLIAESDLNDTRLIRPPELGGFGLDAQWNDDFHHSLHTLITGEQDGYYHDFGSLEQLIKSFREGYVYTGQYSSFRKRRHGTTSVDRPARQFVVCSQNHDQVGNRMLGERLTDLVDIQSLKLAAAATILSPFLPLLFMGEEYGENAPFLYFVNHGDPHLVEAIRKGRAEEFGSFQWHESPPDPQSEETFERSILNHSLKNEPPHKYLLEFYRRLINRRKNTPALSNPDKYKQNVLEDRHANVIFIHRWFGDNHAILLLNFDRENRSVEFPIPPGEWKKSLDSADFPPEKKTTSPEEITTSSEIIRFDVSSRSSVLYLKES